MTPAIRLDQITKTYVTFKKNPGFAGTVKNLFRREHVNVAAVKPTTFQIERGEFVGLLGPNGAGKTTLLKIMTGLIPPSSGQTVAFGEYDTSRRAQGYLRRIGMVMGQRNQLHPDLPAHDSFRLAQAIYAIDEHSFKQRLSQALHLFDVEKKLNIPVRKLSLGERMKMELILAILHSPELLFLDEPTIGLDFNAAKQIRNFLAEANRVLGITIVLTSHYTKDIEELCRRVILINAGQLIYDGALSGLDTRLQAERMMTFELTNDTNVNLLKTQINGLKCGQPIIESRPDGHTLTLVQPLHGVADTVQKIIEFVGPSAIKDVTISERSLEDIFANLYSQGSTTGSQNDAGNDR